MNKFFTDESWADYVFWQENDKRFIKRINELIKEIERSPFTSIGKPEPLKHHLSGYWSRRINEEHRLIYRVDQDRMIILSCRYHY